MHFTLFQDTEEQSAPKSETQDDPPTSAGDDKWREFKSKTDNFLTNLKSKFSNEERRSSTGRNEKVFIPAVHVFMQPKVINQRKKIQRKSSCPDMTQTRGKRGTIARNISLPILGDASEKISNKFPSEHFEENADKIPKHEPENRNVSRFQRLQSVEEDPED